ncbi:MAG: hypothetical protein DI544_13560 [Sphingomonas taxi]|uniref:Uncharacterized protein n=1 Tax=Sphingomonas taxi TaxID=1549858 RepID=A0A2W5P0K1_9SPHN|nr:MAG: hypothetical protein DI544_13560 [Sphingomonas taxi]
MTVTVTPNAAITATHAAGELGTKLRLCQEQVRARPQSAVAEHNLAAVLGDLGDAAGALRATERALAKGGRAPETQLVRARALQALGALDEAEQAFVAAIAARPDYAVAHRDLAQLRWMRSADLPHAMRQLDAAPDTLELALVRSIVLQAGGREDVAAGVLGAALARAPTALPLLIAAAALEARRGRPEEQLRHATAALRAAPGDIAAARAAVEALLHVGRTGEGAELAERIVAAAPGDQGAVALLATAWRLTGDARYAALCEDPALVSTELLVPPASWRDLPAFLGDLAGALEALHAWRTHPLEQSLRHGSQTQIDLTKADVPVIRALFAALDVPIRAHLDRLGTGSDPVRCRLTGGYRFAGAWSVRLIPGGYHTDHVHPAGWISSAFYVALPEADRAAPEGWLSLGRPGVPTRPSLPPSSRIAPAPGMLALFPSYMWHGTEPFGGERPRLTVAFDLLPA